MKSQSASIASILMTALMLFAPPVSASVQGPCSNCHTMHNSQDGADMVPGAKGVQQTLLNDDCVGCHTNNGTATIVDMGNGDRVPIVFNTVQPTYPPNGSASSVLAGGNFYWVAQNGGDAMGHNVYGISEADSVLSGPAWTFFAPGHSTSCSPCHDTLATESSGCKGCHYPRHHARDTAEVVEAAGGWYRFLGALPAMMANPALYGVKGIEEEDWEQNPSAGKHNGYFGTSAVYDKELFMTRYSIGQFCCGCHGNFHHEMNSDQPVDYAGAWLRHPSDVVIPDSGEYAAYTDYNPLAPVAKTDLAGRKNYSGVDLGQDVVTCISCHRPHGSPYPDMLRWDYDTCVAGTESAECGCFVCHTTKDD
ncbi:MAG: hypothetical protein HY885_02430 [Deltaproteobacteria bacterium]|nr:hypothetical protein [Deltaproteobacteria bacterium]